MVTKQTEYNRKWSKKQNESGLCIWCKNKKLEHSKLCEWCYFKVTAQTTLKNRSLAKDIQDLFYLQEERCYITGHKLVLGLNSGLDHLEPQSKSPHLTSEITNVRWVDKKINEMKRDLTINEFVAVCKLIAERHSDGIDLVVSAD